MRTRFFFLQHCGPSWGWFSSREYYATCRTVCSRKLRRIRTGAFGPEAANTIFNHLQDPLTAATSPPPKKTANSVPWLTPCHIRQQWGFGLAPHLRMYPEIITCQGFVALERVMIAKGPLILPKGFGVVPLLDPTRGDQMSRYILYTMYRIHNMVHTLGCAHAGM